MRPTTLEATLIALIKLRRPVYIEGGPGLGKTQTGQQAANTLGIGFIQLHAPTMQPEDLALPAPNAGRTAIDFMINSRLPVEGSNHPDEGVLFIDELPQADLAIQKTLANLIQEREVYGHKLKPGWTIIATGNRVSDRAGANRLLSHLRNRMTTLVFEPSLDDWCNWALANNVRPEVVQFIRFKPSNLNDFKADQEANPTPRAWAEGVSPIIDNVPAEAEYECVMGAVGEGAAAEFIGFLKIYRKLPNPDAIIMNPDTSPVPSEANVRYAIAGALGYRANASNFGQILKYMRRLPTEFCVMTVLDAIRKDPSVANTPDFVDWASKEGTKVLL